MEATPIPAPQEFNATIFDEEDETALYNLFMHYDFDEDDDDEDYVDFGVSPTSDCASSTPDPRNSSPGDSHDKTNTVNDGENDQAGGSSRSDGRRLELGEEEGGLVASTKKGQDQVVVERKKKVEEEDIENRGEDDVEEEEEEEGGDEDEDEDDENNEEDEVATNLQIPVFV